MIESTSNTLKSIDDSKAREDWNWDHKFNISKMTESMLNGLKNKYNISKN